MIFSRVDIESVDDDRSESWFAASVNGEKRKVSACTHTALWYLVAAPNHVLHRPLNRVENERIESTRDSAMQAAGGCRLRANPQCTLASSLVLGVFYS